MYSVKATSHATGLTPETLRAWERRYGVVKPERDSNGRRLYSPDDISRLTLLSEAVRAGHPIGKLAALPDEELTRLARPERSGPEAASTVNEIVEAVSAFDARHLDRLLGRAMNGFPPAELVASVLSPALVEIGERWHAGTMTIAQERLLTSSVRRLVDSVVHQMQIGAREPSIVFGTLPGELHGLGSLLSTYVVASHGCRCVCLDPDMPGEELARFAERFGARVLGLSLVMANRVDAQLAEIRAIRSRLAGSCELWLGGRALSGMTSHLPPGCVAIRDVHELERRIEVLGNSSG